MNCPACGNALTKTRAGAIAVDVCQQGCGGVWFDNHELKKVDEQHEAEGEELLEIEHGTVSLDPDHRRKCPRCGDFALRQHFFSVARSVAIDECPGCAGIWLDAGELGQIRALFKTEEERKEAAGKYFKEEFGPALEEMKKDSEQGLRRARRFSRMFRYICPSQYIPGKQSWGAF